jgi:hypothetical protein
MATKSSPLTLEDLMQAQQQMLRNSDLTESQRKTAEQQIAKLEQLRVGQNKMTDPRGDASHVTLGDVREELRTLNAEGDAPKPGRPALPRMLRPSDPIDVPAREIPDQPTDTREAQLDRLKKIGNVIERKTELQKGGARNEGLNVRNAQAFDKFIAETEKRDTILADANAEQVKIFERIEETLLKLREAGSDDSKRLREELAGLSGELSQTGDTKSKSKIDSVLTNAQRTAAGGNRGNTGTLGDAFQAAMGKKAVAKEGYTYDERTKRYHEFDAKTGKVGKMAKAGDAKMGRLAGAASILGNFIGNKTEEFVEGKRSERVQGFLDNFRSTESGTRGEQIANLQGQQNQLGREPSALALPQKTAPKMVIGSPGTAAAGRGAGQRLQAQTLNITGQVIQLKAAKVEMAGSSDPKLYEDSGGRSGEKRKEEAQATATAAPAESGSGIGVGDVLDVGRAGISKAGGMLRGAGSAILSGGKTVLGKAGGFIKGLSPAIKGGGAAALLGMGASYAGDKLKEAGHEKTGSALDVAGQAASWGGTGAMIGSVVPGVGTAIGAGVGAVAGGAYGLYKNWGSLFGSKKDAAPAQVQASQPGGTSSVPAPATPAPIQAKDMSPEDLKNYGDAYQKARDSGAGVAEAKQLARDSVQVKRDMVKARDGDTSATAAPATKPSTGADIGNRSAANEQAKGTPNKPVVITNNNVAPSSGGGQTQTFARRGAVRPDESAMERYANRNAHFF